MERALDAVLPEWDWHEVHSRIVAVSPEQALAALSSTPIATGLVAVLFRARGLKPGGTILDGLARIQFAELVRSPTEIVAGACGSPWRIRGQMGSIASPRPKTVLVALDMRAEAVGDGRSLLSTETRIKAVDDHARRAFGRYWLVIGPWSALIRRSWLKSAAARAGATDA